MTNRTITLTAPMQRAIIKAIGASWARAICYATIPCHERIWNYPVGGDLKRRLEWSRGQTNDARGFADILDALGVDRPSVDTTQYLKPYHGPSKSAQAGDLQFIGRYCDDHRAALVAAMLAQVK